MYCPRVHEDESSTIGDNEYDASGDESESGDDGDGDDGAPVGGDEYGGAARSYERINIASVTIEVIGAYCAAWAEADRERTRRKMAVEEETMLTMKIRDK